MSTVTRTTTLKSQEPAPVKGDQSPLFDKSNYTWMIAGVVLVLLGFVLMSGGKSPDPHKFNYDEVFSPMRITVAPILILLGFAVEAYAIMKKPATKA
jgi:heme/copper-type cytochrome/quinol oxidase subunit 2